MRDVEKLSASGLKAFKECPRQFQLKYLIEEIKPPDEEEPKHFATGNCVHDTLEYVLKNYSEIDDESDLRAYLDQEKVQFSSERQDDSQVNNCFDTASRWIPSFVESVNQVEEEWRIEIDGIEFVGFADLVADLRFQGEIYDDVIVDWKTGSENEEWKERIQSGVYIEMFYRKYGHYPDAAVFVYLDEETQSFHSRIQEGEVFWNEHRNKYWEEIESYRNEILRLQSEDRWETKPETANCYFCDYKYYCRDSPVGAEDVGIKEINIGDIL